jgi:hypothetical protein
MVGAYGGQLTLSLGDVPFLGQEADIPRSLYGMRAADSEMPLLPTRL